MRRRHLLSTMGVVIGMILLARVEPGTQSSSVSGQPVAAETSTWTLPRTPDGQPDLQGLWSNLTTTPLERPSKYGDRAFLTDEEFAEATAAARKSFEHDLSGEGQQPEENPTQRSVDRTAYNAHWFDRKGGPMQRTSLIIDPPEGRIPALKPEARQRYEAWGAGTGRTAADLTRTGSLMFGTRSDHPEDRGLSERCLTFAPLPRLPGVYNNNFHIVQTPELVVIEMETIHEARVIPLDGRPHLPSHVRQWLGDSRGRWNGDTLVIDTTNFTDRAPFYGSFEGLHLVERLTRVDAGTINYEVTIDDPTTFTKPWTMAFPLTTMKDKVSQMFEYACHEGNYGQEGSLRSARAEDRANSAAKKRSK